MTNEEVIVKLSMLQQEAGKMEEQINLVNHKISELEMLKLNLSNIKENEDILASLGNGIFVKSQTKDTKLLVNIGSDILVKKDAKDAGEIVERQIVRLESVRRQFYQELERLTSEMQSIVEKIQETES